MFFRSAFFNFLSRLKESSLMKSGKLSAYSLLFQIHCGVLSQISECFNYFSHPRVYITEHFLRWNLILPCSFAWHTCPLAKEGGRWESVFLKEWGYYVSVWYEAQTSCFLPQGEWQYSHFSVWFLWICYGSLHFFHLSSLACVSSNVLP